MTRGRSSINQYAILDGCGMGGTGNGWSDSTLSSSFAHSPEYKASLALNHRNGQTSQWKDHFSRETITIGNNRIVR